MRLAKMSTASHLRDSAGSDVGESEETWREAASVLNMASGVPISSPRKVSPKETRDLLSSEKTGPWEAGGIFKSLKTKFQESDLVKRWRQGSAETETANGKLSQAPIDILKPESGESSKTCSETSPASKFSAASAPLDIKIVSMKPSTQSRGDSILANGSDNSSSGAGLAGTSPPSGGGVSLPSTPPTLYHPLYNKAMEWKDKNRAESKKITLDVHRKYSAQEDDINFLLNSSGSQLPAAPTKARYTYLRVTIEKVALSDLPQFAKRSPYVMFSIEGKTQSTPRAPTKGPKEWPEWSCSFDVSDPFADISLSLFAAKAGSEVVAMEDEYVGKAFIPLSACLSHAPERYIRTLFSLSGPSTFEFSLGLNLLAIPPQNKSYARCVEGMPSTGLSRPHESTGQVVLTLRIETKAPLYKALMFAPPVRRSVLPSKEEMLNPALIQQRKMRLKNITAQFSIVFMILVEGILSWRNPFATWIWLTIFAQVCLFSAPYEWPFFVALCTVLGAYFVHIERTRLGPMPCPALYTDETSIDPELPQTLPAKVRALQQLASGVQVMMGLVATILERIYFSLSWDDPLLSFIVSLVLLGGSFGLSVILMLIYECAFIIRLMVFVGGVVLLVPSSFQTFLRSKTAGLKESSASAIKSVLSPHYPVETLEELFQRGDDANAYDLAEKTQSHHVPAKHELKGALHNLWRRVPDGLEIDHRRIAWQRQLVRINENETQGL